MIKQRGVVVFLQFFFFLFFGVGFLGGEGFLLFIISILFFITSATSPSSKPHGVMLLGDLNSQKHEHTMYTFLSCRQARQHRQLQVHLFFFIRTLVRSLASAAASRHLSRGRAASGQGRAPPAGCRGGGERESERERERSGLALPCPGAREREKEGARREERAGRWRLEAQQRKGG